MQRMHKFLCLPSADRRFLVQAAFLLGVVRLGLWLLPFGSLRRLLARMTQVPPEPRETDRASMDRITWAVTVTSRYIPMTTCLTQAMVTQVLLGQCGHPASLRVGVARSEAGQLQAHAWVESQGRIVLGNLKDLSRYAPLPPLEGESP
jgi:hypothetical protein